MTTTYHDVTITRANTLLDRLTTLRVWLASGFMPYLQPAVASLEALKPVLEAVLAGRPIQTGFQEDRGWVWRECTDPGFTLDPVHYRVKPQKRTVCHRRYVWHSSHDGLDHPALASFTKGKEDTPPEDGSTLIGFVRWIDGDWRETTLED